jgi:hypothetical protein
MTLSIRVVERVLADHLPMQSHYAQWLRPQV